MTSRRWVRLCAGQWMASIWSQRTSRMLCRSILFRQRKHRQRRCGERAEEDVGGKAKVPGLRSDDKVGQRASQEPLSFPASRRSVRLGVLYLAGVCSLSSFALALDGAPQDF